MRVLITGGAGFVGSRLGHSFAAAGHGVVALDNLRRRGSETNLAPLAAAGIRFVHGDVRQSADLADLDGTFDLVIDASAEPSVHAGGDGSPAYVLQTNLGGTLNVLEFCRARAGALIFLSSSRVYSMRPLRELRYDETELRFELADEQPLPGATGLGVSERFAVDQPRSFYGASKLASELVIQEYADSYGLRAVINRCGIISGAGQFGRSEQGVVALWAAHHLLRKPLRYIGFGGEGKQVRDVLHPDDLFRLVNAQLERIGECTGRTYNVGGGRERSISLRELSAICRDATGNRVEIGSVPETSRVDIPIYLSDCRKVTGDLGWEPNWSVSGIVAEIVAWLRRDRERLRSVFE